MAGWQRRFVINRTTKRAPSIAAVLAILVALGACGSDEMSLTEYVEQVNEAAAQAGERATELTEQGVLAGDITPQQVEDGLMQALATIRIPLQEAVDAMQPPEQVAAMHSLLWGWHADFITVETALAERFGATPDTEAGWTELSDSQEMVAYRAAIEDGKQVCIDFQAQLDETEERGAFEDVAWLPGELSEVVNAALGCEWFPDDPQSIYRYPLP